MHILHILRIFKKTLWRWTFSVKLKSVNRELIQNGNNFCDSLFFQSFQVAKNDIINNGKIRFEKIYLLEERLREQLYLGIRITIRDRMRSRYSRRPVLAADSSGELFRHFSLLSFSPLVSLRSILTIIISFIFDAHVRI